MKKLSTKDFILLMVEMLVSVLAAVGFIIAASTYSNIVYALAIVNIVMWYVLISTVIKFSSRRS